MRPLDLGSFYIDGAWVPAGDVPTHAVVNPATEAVVGRVSLGTAAHVEQAVAAARRAFASYAQTSRDERLALLGRITECYAARLSDLAAAISVEMGAPMALANAAQAPSGLGHLMHAAEVLKTLPLEEVRGRNLIVREPIGVCGFITPWNWPANQIMCKVAPALAAGCTMVLKPSEMTPSNAVIIAEILHEAGVPKGVFNLVHGDGPGVGAALAAHPDVDLVSFTGSTRAGVLVAKAAADSVKRVTQELGGKSPNIVLADADLEQSVRHGVATVFRNSGQSCNAPTRMLVPRTRHAEALRIAAAAAAEVRVDDPSEGGDVMGPVANGAQFQKIQALIQRGLDEGATLVAGGVGRPAGREAGFYVRPTVFGDVRNDMTIAREEIFGPVLCILPYDDEAEAVAIANDTEYGLSAYVQGSPESAMRVARQLRAGQVHLNQAGADFSAPFGGYKKSGNGREWGAEGVLEFFETKALLQPE
ncbi:MAG: aldehyde dehydrogenase family protein [Polyangiales bacterium]